MLGILPRGLQTIAQGLPQPPVLSGFIGTRRHSFVYLLSVAAVMLSVESSHCDKDWAIKPKILLVWYGKSWSASLLSHYVYIKNIFEREAEREGDRESHAGFLLSA